MVYILGIKIYLHAHTNTLKTTEKTQHNKSKSKQFSPLPFPFVDTYKVNLLSDFFSFPILVYNPGFLKQHNLLAIKKSNTL